MKIETENKIISSINFRKIFSVLVICAMTPACTGISYMDNKSVTELREQYDLGSKSKDPHDYLPKQFGAFIIPAASDNPDEAPHIFLLRREKSKYYAQTMLSDNTEDKKALFKRTYLDFGIDGGNKGFLSRLTLKF